MCIFDPYLSGSSDVNLVNVTKVQKAQEKPETERRKVNRFGQSYLGAEV